MWSKEEEAQIGRDREYRDQRLAEIKIALRAEVERLKEELAESLTARRVLAKTVEKVGANLQAAESRLAAIRAKVVLLLTRIAGVTRAHVGEGFPEGPVVFEREIAALVRKARVALEGDASQDGKTHHIRGCPLSPAAHVPAPDGTACECARIRRDVACLAAPVSRYPCSPTCTHDDAATPGHPERVKARSEAVKKAVCDHGDCWTCPCEQCPTYERGAEAMRAASWEAVQHVLQKYGISEASPMREDMKSAIEGAVP